MLFVLGCCAGFMWLFRSGWQITVALAVVYLACFVLAHVLGLAIGSWPSVIVVAAVAASAAYLWSDRRINSRNLV